MDVTPKHRAEQTLCLYCGGLPSTLCTHHVQDWVPRHRRSLSMWDRPAGSDPRVVVVQFPRTPRSW